MDYGAVLTSGNRVRIPEEVLQTLKLDLGDLVLFTIDNGKVTMWPAEVRKRDVLHDQ